MTKNYYNNNRATNRSFDDGNDSGDNIGLNIDNGDDDDNSSISDDDNDEAKELEDFKGKLILLINDGARNGDKAKANGEEVEHKKKNGTATASNPELFLLKEQIPSLHITPPITPQHIISSISTKKATMEGTMTKSTSANSILKKENSSSSFLSSTDSAVRFGSIEIHEHAIVLGGSVPLTGPSLTLAWERLSYHKINSIDNHHRQQQQQQQQQKSFNKSAKRQQELIRPRPA
jgi:hypothetical protein